MREELRRSDVRLGVALSRAILLGASLVGFGLPASAQLAISDSGAPVYSHPLAVPAGVSGMAPHLSLLHAGGAGNGPFGVSWSLQGLSVIARCPATTATDGKTGGVAYGPADKLCLDGMRLIQTNESGNASATANAVNIPVATQVNDAKGLSATTYREFRTERDSFARIRAYGYANGDTSGASGPAYFKVWLKSGQIYEYGASPNANALSNAMITRYQASGAGVPMAWAVARVADTAGNDVLISKMTQPHEPGALGTERSETRREPGVRGWFAG